MNRRKRTLPKSLALIVLTITGSSALAGIRDSGGGNGVVCMSSVAEADQVRAAGFVTDNLLGQISSVEAYDLYEAKLVNRNSTNSIIAPENPNQFQSFAHQISNRFHAYVPEVSKIIETNSARLQSILWVGALRNIDDTHRALELGDPRCAVITMAAQDSMGQQTRLYLDQRLFNHPKHSDLSRSVLFLHEVLYLQARDRGQTDSKNTRYFLGQLISKNDSVNSDSITRLLFELDLLEGGPSWTDLSQIWQSTKQAYKETLETAVATYRDPGMSWPKTSLVEEANSVFTQILRHSGNNPDTEQYLKLGCARALSGAPADLVPNQVSSCRYTLETVLFQIPGITSPLTRTDELARQNIVDKLKEYESGIPSLLQDRFQKVFQGLVRPHILASFSEYPDSIKGKLVQYVDHFASEVVQWPIQVKRLSEYTDARHVTPFCEKTDESSYSHQEGELLDSLNYKEVSTLPVP